MVYTCPDSPHIPFFFETYPELSDRYNMQRSAMTTTTHEPAVHHQMEPRHNQAEGANRLYSGRAAVYNSSWHPEFAANFVSMLPLSPGQHVLDLGCGTGLVSFDAAVVVGPTGRVVGVDVTRAMLEEAKDRKRIEGQEADNVKFLECDVMRLDAIKELEPESFDAVTMLSALVLFDDPSAVVKLMTRYLKPGGVLAVDATHPKNLIGGMIMEKTALKMGIKMPYYRSWSQSEDSLRELLERNDLIVDKCELVEQRGFGKRFYRVDEADRVFNEMMEGEASWPFRENGSDTFTEAREIFRQEWASAAVDGKVEEVDGVFVAVARKKPSESTKDATFAFTGGCRCGSVRFASSQLPKSLEVCHCFTCGRLSGCGFLPFVGLPRSALTYTCSSTLKAMSVTDLAKRTFCNACGTPITMEYNATPNSIGLIAGTIDLETVKGELPKVSKHIFLKEKMSWDVLPDDGAERHQDMPGGIPGEKGGCCCMNSG